MSTPNTPAELALINDAQFLEELQQVDFNRRAGDSGFAAKPLDNDAYDALDDGLPVRPGVPELPLPDDDPHRDAASYPPYDDPPPAPRESSVPLFTAMIVIVACLTAGAATAAWVFHDSLSRINVTSIRPASR